MSDNIYNQRTDYTNNPPLDIQDMSTNPFDVFHNWYERALEVIPKDPNAMILSTLSKDQPRARVVLLKQLDERGFTYFTNYDSDKVQETNSHNKAALTFFWSALERQVRVEGVVEKVTEAESDAYFLNRPVGSRLGAWASPQSKEIESRTILERNIEAYKQKFGNQDVQRPKNWGGLRLVPNYFEFWQGAASRLHDRIVYEKVGNNWIKKRLAP